MLFNLPRGTEPHTFLVDEPEVACHRNNLASKLSNVSMPKAKQQFYTHSQIFRLRAMSYACPVP